MLQEEEEMGMNISYESSNRLKIPVKSVSGRWVVHITNHAPVKNGIWEMLSEAALSYFLQ